VVRPSSQPSLQPTGIPSELPQISHRPTTTRSPTSTPIPTLRIHSLKDNYLKFKEALFFFGSYLPTPVEETPDIHLNEPFIGSSYMIFGFKDNEERRRTTKEITLGSRESLGLYTPVENSGLVEEKVMSRSSFPIGDFNGDSFQDLLVCDPVNSLCQMYAQKPSGSDLFERFLEIKNENNDLFGWSIARLGDLNDISDHCDDIAITSLSSNLIYLFFGSKAYSKAQQNVITIPNSNTLPVSTGIQIIGSSNDQNIGLALSSAGDFNQDGFTDIVFSAIQITPYLNVIYILFLTTELIKQDISMDNLDPLRNYLKIESPLFAFAGFSLSGLGDINQDGFDDIVIGSVPYSGRYLTQKGYVIYGRKNNSSGVALDLSHVSSEDGFTITGGGFIVAGPGDLNGDGINDIMISSYDQWQGKANSYLMVYPTEIISNPPTFLPSSRPSSSPSLVPSASPSKKVQFPTNLPTVKETTNQPVNEGTFPPFLQRTEAPSLAPRTTKPTRMPSFKPSTRGPTRSPSSPPSFLPSRKPTAIPTRKPTTFPTTKLPTRSPTNRPVLSIYPTSFPSSSPTESLSTPFQEILIENAGIYEAPVGKGNFIISGEGSIVIKGSGEGKKIYTVLPSANSITITDFDKRNDVIDLIHFPSFYSIDDLVYRTNPLQIFLSSSSATGNNNQRIILLSLDAADLSEENFLFQKNNNDETDTATKKKITDFQFSISSIIALGLLVSCIGLFTFVSKMNEKDEEDDSKLFFNHKEESSPNDQKKNEMDEKSSSGLDSSLLFSSSEEEEEEDDDDNSLSDGSDIFQQEDNEEDEDLLASMKSWFSSDGAIHREDEGTAREENHELDNDFQFLRQLLEGNLSTNMDNEQQEQPSPLGIFTTFDPEDEEENEHREATIVHDEHDIDIEGNHSGNYDTGNDYSDDRYTYSNEKKKRNDEVDGNDWLP
jgi:hypothetical protein